MSFVAAFLVGVVATLLVSLLALAFFYWHGERQGREASARQLPMYVQGRTIWTTIHAESDALAAEALVALMEREEA